MNDIFNKMIILREDIFALNILKKCCDVQQKGISDNPLWMMLQFWHFGCLQRLFCKLWGNSVIKLIVIWRSAANAYLGNVMSRIAFFPCRHITHDLILDIQSLLGSINLLDRNLLQIFLLIHLNGYFFLANKTKEKPSM